MTFHPLVADAWAWVVARVPAEDVALVSEIVCVTQADMAATLGHAVTCAETDFAERRIKVAIDGGCLHRSYLDAALMHELGHVREWVHNQDASEVAADRYLVQHWPDDQAYEW